MPVRSHEPEDHHLAHARGDREWFPPLEQALDEPEGLLAAGGDLSPPRLLAAYRRGIFPWYSAGQPVLWWAPDPREVLVPARIPLLAQPRQNAAKSWL